MGNTDYLLNDWPLEAFAIEQVNFLQQDILETLNETRNASEALCQAYEMLPDEQKIAFILAGGVPSLFQWQQYHFQELRAGSDRETGQLPVVC